MIRGNNGFVEGKLVETKFNQVDSDDEYPPLQALLEYVSVYHLMNISWLYDYFYKAEEAMGETEDSELAFFSSQTI